MDPVFCGTTGYLIWVVMVLFCPLIRCDTEEVCQAENFEGRCPDNSAIIMETALYGRMKLGRCIKVDLGYLGCQSDVISLLDKWCSGLQECDLFVPNQELKSANIDCVEGITPYLRIEYTCVTVTSPDSQRCTSPTRVNIHGNEGYISSHVATQTGCGSPRAPWIVEVPPGQTIDMWLLDFGALGRRESTLGLGCQQTLGYIVERNLGSNFTICGDDNRRKHIYTTKTNKAEITINSKPDDHQRILIQYKIIGCSDLTPPAHAWYKREDNEAVIGCKSNDRVWRLYCNGNTWDGVVGNCSKSPDKTGDPEVGVLLPFSSVIFLTGVVCGAILLIIVVVVAGAVYVKKQSIKHELKLRSDYACTTLPSAQYYATKPPGYDVTMNRTMPQIGDSQPLVQIVDRTLSKTKPTHVND